MVMTVEVAITAGLLNFAVCSDATGWLEQALGMIFLASRRQGLEAGVNVPLTDRNLEHAARSMRRRTTAVAGAVGATYTVSMISSMKLQWTCRSYLPQ